MKIIPIIMLLFCVGYASACKHSKNHSNNTVSKNRNTGLSENPSLWHGVNLNNKAVQRLSLADFKYAADAGANVIRLAVYADQEDGKTFVAFLNTDGTPLPINNNPGLASLQKAVSLAASVNVKIIIDMHTSPGIRGAKIWQDEHYWDELTQIWTLIAQKFKNNNTVIAFDLMNEPKIIDYIKNQNLVQKGTDEAEMYLGKWSPPANWANTPRDYNLQMGKLIGAIRQVDENRCVIVEGFGILGNPVNFSWMKPITGFKNVVYSFHMYVPTGITMLGTKGSKQKGNDNNVAPFDPVADGAKIDKALAPVLSFQRKYNVPIYVGEFGVTTNAVFDTDASGKPYNGACWLSTIVKKMNAYKWGWTYWNFETKIRMPQSDTDPRYIILSAAMKNQPIPDYCK